MLGCPAQEAEGWGRETAELSSLGAGPGFRLPQKEKNCPISFFLGLYFHELPPTGDLELLGTCLECYWQQKKRMAPGCEPLAVGRMMGALRPYVHGQCLAGAGGGGFLYVLTKAPRQKEALHQILAKIEVKKRLPGPKVLEGAAAKLSSAGGLLMGVSPLCYLSSSPFCSFFSRGWVISASTASKWTLGTSRWRFWDASWTPVLLQERMWLCEGLGSALLITDTWD